MLLIPELRSTECGEDGCSWTFAPLLLHYNFSLVLLQFLLLAFHLMLDDLTALNQWGRGLFCLIFFASILFFLKFLIEPIFEYL
mmetsp:Transcript_5578/g.9677  ORF Transcript_5578/g.9677 Transcript_5578/m.9677 type:complete len:84 (+) Transcript_5578:33-284(+)